jgi:hypothetical protein
MPSSVALLFFNLNYFGKAAVSGFFLTMCWTALISAQHRYDKKGGTVSRDFRTLFFFFIKQSPVGP